MYLLSPNTVTRFAIESCDLLKTRNTPVKIFDHKNSFGIIRSPWGPAYDHSMLTLLGNGELPTWLSPFHIRTLIIPPDVLIHLTLGWTVSSPLIEQRGITFEGHIYIALCHLALFR